MQKVGNIIPYFIKELGSTFKDREVVSWAYLSIEHLLGYNPSACIIHANNSIDIKMSNKLQKIIADLKIKRPLQYILGETTFYGLKLKVNEHTLIPRSETEELVDMIIKNESTEKIKTILDIGSGSGCIAITLDKNVKSKVIGLDVSEKAIIIAKNNNINVGANVTFIQKKIEE